MLPLITAALGLLQNNQQNESNRKRDMQAAAMGKFAQMPPPRGTDLSKVGEEFDKSLWGEDTKPGAGPQDPAGTAPVGQTNPTGNKLSALPPDDDFAQGLAKFQTGMNDFDGMRDDDMQRRIEELRRGL